MIGQMGNAMGGGPPPLPNSTFYVAIDGQQSGPFDLGSLSTLVHQGKISRDSLVWRQGLTQWVVASSLAELTAVFVTTPPPLPPQ